MARAATFSWAECGARSLDALTAGLARGAAARSTAPVGPSA
jgi:hypothetical protein